jgi:hypothetical protein
MQKSIELGIGKDHPNVLIPILYGAIDRYLKGREETDMDKVVADVCKRNKISKKNLDMILQKYVGLPNQIKRYWSGNDYDKLMKVDNFKEATKQLLLEIPTKVKRTPPGLQSPYTVRPKLEDYEEILSSRIRRKIYPKIYTTIPPIFSGWVIEFEPESPSSSEPEEPPTNRYMWEFGPDLYCYDEYEDWDFGWFGKYNLGDDLYAVYAWGDGTGEIKVGRIPKTNGTNDLDPGETGTWPYPERVIYPAKAPGGYLHIEIDIYEQDYSLDVLGDFIDFVAPFCETVGGLIGGEAGAEMGEAVGDALEAVRSLFNDEDDDNYLGSLEFDYPKGETDLHTFIGARNVDFHGNDCHYRFNYVIRELAP